MPRYISFSMTTPQFIEKRKDVTRRYGWLNLKAGDVLIGVEKAMGLQKGEKIKKIRKIEILSVRREPLRAMMDDLDYGNDEMRREGYPFGLKSPVIFCKTLANTSKKSVDDLITRIEFKHLEDINEQ